VQIEPFAHGPTDGAPGSMPTDQDREAGVHRLQQAVGDGRLTLGEFTDRLDVVLAAESAAQLRAVLDDLPTAAAVVGTAAPTSFGVFGVFGDVVLSGRWRLRERNRAATVFGDVRVDLRDSVCVEPEVRVEGLTVFGDVVVTVPEGVEAELSGFTIFGDRRLDLAPVPRQPQTPLVRVRGLTVFGDLRVRSSPPGRRSDRSRHRR